MKKEKLKNLPSLIKSLLILSLFIFGSLRIIAFAKGIMEEKKDQQVMREIQTEGIQLLQEKEVIHQKSNQRVLVESRKYNHEEMLKKNSDYTGWIYIPGTGIDYPVTIGDKYIDTGFDGRKDISGNTFIQDGYSPKQKYFVIFGHNMGRGSNTMFSPIKNFKLKDYYQEHPDLYFNEIGGEKSKYKIIGFMEFDYRKFDGYDYVKTDFQDEREFEEYKKISMEKMLHYEEEFKNLVYNEDRLLIVSTCDTDILGRTDWKRLVLFAVQE